MLYLPQPPSPCGSVNSLTASPPSSVSLVSSNPSILLSEYDSSEGKLHNEIISDNSDCSNASFITGSETLTGDASCSVDQRHQWYVNRWRDIAKKALAQHRYKVAVDIVNARYLRKVTWKETKAQQWARRSGKKMSVASQRRRSMVSPKVHKFFFKISAWKKFFIPIGYVFLTFGYAFIGGGMYYFLENQAEIDLVYVARRERNALIDIAATNLTTSLGRSHNCNMSNVSFEFVKDFLIQYHIETDLYPSNEIHWTLLGSAWFALTIFTTIGYGNFAPNTIGGRLFTMMYALLGIPLLLLTLNEIGKLFTWSLKKAYNKIIKCCTRVKKHVQVARSKITFCRRHKYTQPSEENGSVQPKLSCQTNEDILSTYSKDDWKEFDFPIPIAIGLIVIWIIVVSYVTTWCEDFDLVTSIYFWYITFTTIGLGDFTPKHASTGFMFLPILFVGLSLISMVITLLQSKIERFEDIVLEDYLGWETESANSSDDDDSPTYLDIGWEAIELRPKPSAVTLDGTRLSHPAGEDGGFTLGIFRGPSERDLSSSRTSLAKRTITIWNRRTASVGALGSRKPSRPLPPRRLPTNISRVLEIQKASKGVHRVRRGIQTDESFLFESRMGEGLSWKRARKHNQNVRMDKAISFDPACV